MNQEEREVIERLVEAVKQLRQASTFDETCRSHNAIDRARRDLEDHLSIPVEEDRDEAHRPKHQYWLELWSEEEGWYTAGCGYDQDTLEEGLAMLSWCEEERRRLVRQDSTWTVLQEEQPVVRAGMKPNADPST